MPSWSFWGYFDGQRTLSSARSVHGWVITESWWRGLFPGASLAQSERWARGGNGLAVGFAPRSCRAKLVVFGVKLVVHLVHA